MESPETCAAWMRSLIQTFIDSVSALERSQKTHSDLVGAVAEWAPQIMATLAVSRLSERGQADAAREAVDVEAVLAQQSFRLLTTLLRTAVTRVPPVYDPGVMDRYLPDIIEIAEIIATRKGKEADND